MALVKQTRRISLRKNHRHRKAGPHSPRPSSSSSWEYGHVSSPQSIWPTSNPRPMGEISTWRKTHPTENDLTEELSPFRRYFPRNEYKVCLIPLCQRQLAFHHPFPSRKHVFNSLYGDQKCWLYYINIWCLLWWLCAKVLGPLSKYSPND